MPKTKGTKTTASAAAPNDQATMVVTVYDDSHGLTNPKKVYVLRWIAGKYAGVTEFTPPYTVAI
jgi:hypothetical protein